MYPAPILFSVVARRLRFPGLLVLAVLVAGCASVRDEQTLRPFKANGCSVIPDGVILSCCTDHDIDYWEGGSSARRKEADQRLRQCVLEKTGNRLLSTLVYTGVRVGGSPWWPPGSGGWAYGWSFGRGYADLTEKDWEQIEEAARRQLRRYHEQCQEGDDRACETEAVFSSREEIRHDSGFPGAGN